MFGRLGNLILWPFKMVWGSVTSLWTSFISKEEFQRFFTIAAMFALTIGTYWLLRPVKDGVFLTMVGSEYQPNAKIYSMVVVFFLVMVYSKLVDIFPRHKLLYVLSGFYAIGMLGFALAIQHPVIGIANTVASPYRLLGWAWYFYVESFGSIMVALFWTFVSDTTNPDSAKRGYPLIAFGGQIGGVLGPVSGLYVATNYGTGQALYIAIAGLCGLIGMVYYYMNNLAKTENSFETDVQKKKEDKKKTGFMEGLRLLVTEPYLLGIFGVVSIYEIIVTVLDFQFKLLAKTQYTGDALTAYLSEFAICTNLVALACLLFGAGNIGRRLGLTKTLLLLPALIAICVVTLTYNPVLTMAFAIMVFAKGVNYALNQPAKEQLYIPTSKDSKYKAKGWIDMFGSRSSKGLGSGLNMFLVGGLTGIGAIASFGFIGVWVAAALYVGRAHAKAVKNNELVC